MDNKSETKKLFWKIVNHIENCSDTMTEDEEGNATERGIILLNDYSIMVSNDGIIRIYNKENFPIIHFTEESDSLIVLEELFNILE